MMETSQINRSTGIEKKFKNFLRRDPMTGSAQGLLEKM